MTSVKYDVVGLKIASYQEALEACSGLGIKPIPEYTRIFSEKKASRERLEKVRKAFAEKREVNNNNNNNNNNN